jgi:hypothetical protein
MTASGPSTGTPVVSGAGTSHGGHPAAPVANALHDRIGHLPQMTFRQAGIRNPSLPTLLSLFFLLLAFFIVLNSLSQHDSHKQTNVTASVEQAFGISNADPISASENTEQATTGILRGLASYFGALLPADRQKLLISSNQLTMHLPTDLFFKTANGAITGQPTDQAATILRQVGEALNKRPPGWGCEVSVEVASPSPGAEDIDRAGKMAVMLSSSTTQHRNDLSVGLAAGDAQWLTIAIHLRPPEMPDLPGQKSSATGQVQSGTAQRVAP